MRATDDPAARRLAEALTATAASMRQQAALTDALGFDAAIETALRDVSNDASH
ncbi:hypothetical protein [Microcella alkaliphila]|jgi:hypothetical protein|uniref:Uncharacterized protein n=1 Tax=Microcella alkaliphila TaxID=279828 RepID=A0A0U5BMB3_9MICO|nr:hypothetical protein [Microcella alkaliphila]BAU31302.1 hypothetical protein MalAC0309_0430 [Microcella alkaliphila]